MVAYKKPETAAEQARRAVLQKIYAGVIAGYMVEWKPGDTRMILTNEDGVFEVTVVKKRKA